MRAPRPLVAAVAAFLATGISVDPAVRAPSPPAPPVRAATRDAARRELAPPAHGIGEATGPAPQDLRLEIGPDGHGAHRVLLRRPGFLVSLRNEDARAAGVDWTAVRIAPEGASARLIWEATALERGTETTRGLLLLTRTGDSLAGELRSAAAPEAAGSWESPDASCSAQHDGLGGFTALCRTKPHVRLMGVANVTGAHALDDAWLAPGARPLVRFDLARTPSGGEGRLMGMVRGLAAVVLSVEARFPRGEEATLVFHEATRLQPAPPR